MLEFVSLVTAGYWRSRRNIEGAFWDVDFLLFDVILSGQQQAGVRGDLLEIGALYGKSAIVLGLHAHEGETVVVCDIFGPGGIDSANVVENELSYPDLSRRAFEVNYRRWVPRGPLIVQELSDSIRTHVADTTLRFAHIDGGHHFNVVQADLVNTRPLMAPGGVVVLDDFRALHTPGVAAAAWTAVVNDGLIPVCASEQKLYATWDAAATEGLSELLQNWAREHPEVNAGIQEVAGHNLLVVANPHGTSLRSRVGRWVPPALRELRRPSASVYLGRPL